MFINAIILAGASIILAGAAEVTVFLIVCLLVPHVDLKKQRQYMESRIKIRNDISQNKLKEPYETRRKNCTLNVVLPRCY